MHERAEADFASDYTMTRRCTWVAVAALPPFVGKLEQAQGARFIASSMMIRSF